MPIQKLVEHYCTVPSGLRPALWRIWHKLLNRLDADYATVFLNYGYASHNGEFDHLHLGPQDLPERFGIQLYVHATGGGVSLENASVLEVGCGRGGGAAFLTRYYRPQSYIALDISPSLLAACRKFHKAPGLYFVQGAAEDLPFENARFDAVINVESARCYGNLSAFFEGVFRVLKPGGFFFFADMIKTEDVERVHGLLQNSSFEIKRQKDIRKNIALALQSDAAARKQLIDRRVPGWLQKSFYEFAGVQGSKRFQSFQEGTMQYRSYVLQKPY